VGRRRIDAPRRRSDPVVSGVRMRGRTPVLALVAAGVLLVGLAGPASAHDTLVSVTPADGSTVAVVPGSVDLVFDEPAMALGTEIQVLGPDGKSVSKGAPVLVNATVSQPLTAVRPAGAYTVEWRVTSADGHAISGHFAFHATSAVGSSPAPAASSPAPPPSGEPTPSATPSEPGAAGGSAGQSGLNIGPGAIAVGVGVVLVLTAGAIWWIRRRPT